MIAVIKLYWCNIKPYLLCTQTDYRETQGNRFGKCEVCYSKNVEAFCNKKGEIRMIVAYYGGYGMSRLGYYGFDWTYLLLIAGVILSMMVSSKMKATADKYSRVRSYSGMTGAEAATRILQAAGISYVKVQPVSGHLTDHYDPRTKTVNLSESSYRQTSLTAIGVAAHECGHAIQDAQEYAPLNLRSALVPVANFGSRLSWPIFVLGLFMGITPLTTIGILLFTAAVLFQLVTLPVEFNASSRALVMLENTGIMGQGELDGTKKVLRAAAMTYVAALASSALQLLRLILLAGGRRRDD